MLFIRLCLLGLISSTFISCQANVGSSPPQSRLNSANPSASVDFLDFRIEEINANRAVVRFDTSRETTCEAEYGTTEEQLNQRAADPNMDESNPYAFEHEVPLEDLQADQDYFVRARATDPQGNTFFSKVYRFRTTAQTQATLPAKALSHMTSDANLEITGVSSVFGNSSTFQAQNAIDEQATTEWSSQGDGNDAWLALSWPQPISFQYIQVRSRSMSDGSAIITRFQLRLEDDRLIGPFDLPNAQETHTFALPEPVTSQRVRFEVVNSTGGNTGLRSFNLWQKPVLLVDGLAGD